MMKSKNLCFRKRVLQMNWKINQNTLIMKKAEDGETVTVGAAFPLVFPIIFA